MSTDLAESPETVLQASDVKTHHSVKRSALSTERGSVKAVDGVDLTVARGETLGVVGESGCGKSSLARTIVGLDQATSGSIVFEGTELLSGSRREARKARRQMQMVFQDPQASLDPKMRILDIVTEGMSVGGRRASRRARRERAAELAEMVGLRPDLLQRFPHQLSGGQRQRVGIARALAVDPSLIIADEAVSALDVSVQAQVLNLFIDIQDQLDLSYIFIAHDLSVVEYIADRVGVMYLGRIVELAPARELADEPLMPYSEALLSAVPQSTSERQRERIVLPGELPNPLDPPSGCPFRARCWRATDICGEVRPDLVEIRPARFVACHHPLDQSL